MASAEYVDILALVTTVINTVSPVETSKMANKNIMYNPESSRMKCVASKQRKLKPKAEQQKIPRSLEDERKERYERLKKCAPPGFHLVLEKIIRDVALARPIHICLFIADLLDAQITRRTFDDLLYGCQLKKSLRRVPYPTESCILIKTFLLREGSRAVDDKQFLRGPIPQYGIAEPALDRYRDYAGIGEFEMPLEEKTEEQEVEDKTASAKYAFPEDETASAKHAFAEDECIPENDLESPPALDRYRDYAGIGLFEPDDVDDVCCDHVMLGYPVANCQCMFCTLRAEKKAGCSAEEGEVEKLPKPDPCAPQPVLQTLYIEQAVYREPAYETEQLFKEKDIKAYEPFGEIFQQDEHYEDDGLQPPDPFSEHPADRDTVSESPQQSHPDDPNAKPVPSETFACPPAEPGKVETPAHEPATPEKSPEQTTSRATPSKTTRQPIEERCPAEIRAKEYVERMEINRDPAREEASAPAETSVAEEAEKTDELEETQAITEEETAAPQVEEEAPEEITAAQEVPEAAAEGETTEVEPAAAEPENVEESQPAAAEDQPPEAGTEAEAEAETAAEEIKEEPKEEETKEEAEEDEAKPEEAAVEPTAEEEPAEENAEPTEA